MQSGATQPKFDLFREVSQRRFVVRLAVPRLELALRSHFAVWRPLVSLSVATRFAASRISSPTTCQSPAMPDRWRRVCTRVVRMVARPPRSIMDPTPAAIARIRRIASPCVSVRAIPLLCHVRWLPGGTSDKRARLWNEDPARGPPRTGDEPLLATEAQRSSTEFTDAVNRPDWSAAEGWASTDSRMVDRRKAPDLRRAPARSAALARDVRRPQPTDCPLRVVR